MNTDSIQAKHVSPDEVKQPGDFCFETVTQVGGAGRCLKIWLPGAPHAIRLPVKIGPRDETAWGWDGNPESPTLDPSINVLGIWHGHLTAGKLKSV